MLRGVPESLDLPIKSISLLSGPQLRLGVVLGDLGGVSDRPLADRLNRLAGPGLSDRHPPQCGQPASLLGDLPRLEDELAALKSNTGCDALLGGVIDRDRGGVADRDRASPRRLRGIGVKPGGLMLDIASLRAVSHCLTSL